MPISKYLKDLEPGPLLKALREKMGLKQHGLGQLLSPKKHASEISALEGGEPMGLKRAELFAEFFDVERERFLPKVEAE